VKAPPPPVSPISGELGGTGRLALLAIIVSVLLAAFGSILA
jgi:hypothetical protein